jgi:hypothetical protein
MTPFIPARELDGLLRGSYQEANVRVAEALRGEIDRFGGPVHLVATFQNRAVVMSESGSVFSVAYESASDGSVHILGAEPMQATVVTESNVRKFVQAEAKRAVDLFFKGLTDQALKVAKEILPLADSALLRTDEEIVNTFIESRSARGLWKQFIESRESRIQDYLGEHAPKEPALASRYQKLYDGSTQKDELPKFKGLVEADFGVLRSRIRAVRSQTEAAKHTLTEARAVVEREGGSALASEMSGFVDDLLNDCTIVESFIDEVGQSSGRVDLLAKVFDSLGVEVTSFEVAGAFAAQMATRLADAGS